MGAWAGVGLRLSQPQSLIEGAPMHCRAPRSFFVSFPQLLALIVPPGLLTVEG